MICSKLAPTFLKKPPPPYPKILVKRVADALPLTSFALFTAAAQLYKPKGEKVFALQIEPAPIPLPEDEVEDIFS